MFDMSNSDSDQVLDGEAETISLVGDFMNRHKLPVKMHGVFVFSQPTHVHNLTWDEYPLEPCSNHCVTHSLCLKHRSSLSKMGPWIYLSNRVTTLPKLHKSPQILQFLSLLHGKIKGDKRVKDYLVVCQLVDILGMFTLITRVDLYMANSPLELQTFVQIYKLNDHVDFGDKTQYYIGRDFVERIHEFHVTH